MKRERPYQGLVMDIGVSEGNDTAYYLAKGFRVVAVEADPEMCKKLELRFSGEIDSGALILLNFLASDTFGKGTTFYSHKVHQGVSSVRQRSDVATEGYSSHIVQSIDWRTLQAQAGVPRFLKIDIEGNESAFLSSMSDSECIPEFISVECYSFPVCEMLSQMGYERFKLVDQNPPGGFRLPSRQIEGLRIETAHFVHTSGPFGLDIFCDGGWLTFEEFTDSWNESKPLMNRTWFDCHAWAPR